MRKIILLILTLTIAVSSSSLPIVSAESAYNEGNDKYIRLMYNIGVLDSAAGVEANMTRGEFAKTLTNMLNMNALISGYDKGGFLDVPADYNYVASIEALYNMGVMVGGTDGKIRPNDFITFSEACSALVKLLGYEAMGNARGYTHAATSLGITRGVKFSDAINFGDLSRMLFNALTVPFAKSISLSDGSTLVQSDATLYRDYLGIFESSGKITAVNGLNLYGLPNDDVTQTKVEINGEIYDTLEFFTSDKLGTKVKYWYKLEDDKPVILYAEETLDNEDINLSYSDIEKVTSDYIEYKVSEDKTKKIKLSQSGLRILKDAVPVNSITDIDFTKKGTIRCVIENNTCIAIILMEYKSYVVESVGHKIWFRDTDDFSIDTNDTENIYSIKNSLAYYEISEIEAGDVLSVSHDDRTNVYNIILSRKKAEGIISSSHTKNNGEYFTINDETYGIDKDFKAKTLLDGNDLAELKVGLKSVFYIDFNNEICGMDYSDGFQYAYIKGVADLGSGLSNDYAIRMFTMRHKGFHTYKFNKKVIVNGVEKNRDDAYTIVKAYFDSCNDNKPSVTKFKENFKGEITEIVTDQIAGHTTVDYALSKPVERKIGDGYYYWGLNYYSFFTHNDGFKGDIHLVPKEYGNTLTIKVPSSLEEEKFIGSYAPYDSGLTTEKEGKPVDVMFFDLNENLEPALIVYFADAGGIEVPINLYNVIGVEKASTVVYDDDVAVKIEAYKNGVPMTFIVPNKDVGMFNLAKSLSKGDFVQISYNDENEITAMERYFTYNFDKLASGADFDMSELITEFEKRKTKQGFNGSILFNKVKGKTDYSVVFDGDPVTQQCVFPFHYTYDKSRCLTLFDGKEFSKIKIRDLERDDVIFGYAEDSCFTSVIAIRNVQDMSFVDNNKILP